MRSGTMPGCLRALAAVAIALLVSTGCGRNGPRSVVKHYFRDVQSGKFAECYDLLSDQAKLRYGSRSEFVRYLQEKIGDLQVHVDSFVELPRDKNSDSLRNFTAYLKIVAAPQDTERQRGSVHVIKSNGKWRLEDL